MTVQNQRASVTHLLAPDIECGGCANAIQKSVAALAGVENVAVDITAKVVAVRHSADVGEPELIAALDRAGFPATVIGDKSNAL